MKKLFKYLFGSSPYSHIHDPEERYVALQLTRSLPRISYATINNALLPKSGRIGTAQVDHIVVSVFGIFCIETKKHAGLILASKMTRIFTQRLWSNNYRINPNPVEQNYSHICALNELLKSKLKQPIVNIVVFPSAYKFYIDGYENVGSVEDMMSTMATYTQQVYRFDEAKDIIETICENNLKDVSSHQRHVRNVKAVYS
ncbi:MAG: nuclease-related domain-containing protein [Candidatus Saccharimonas aalborgensis]